MSPRFPPPRPASNSQPPPEDCNTCPANPSGLLSEADRQMLIAVVVEAMRQSVPVLAPALADAIQQAARENFERALGRMLWAWVRRGFAVVLIGGTGAYLWFFKSNRPF